jgi:hypothetical protein
LKHSDDGENQNSDLKFVEDSLLQRMIEYAGMAKEIEHDTFHETDLVCKSLSVIRLQILILNWMISNSVKIIISCHFRIDLMDDSRMVG